MDSFKEYQDMIQDIDKRKAAAIENAWNIEREIDILQTDYNAAEVYSGEDPKTIKRKIDQLQSEHSEAVRVLKAFEAAPKPGSRMLKIADQAVSECKAEIKELQAAYDEQAAVLPGMKSEYMKVIRSLGEINRKGEATARNARNAGKSGSTPKNWIGGVIADVSGPGHIYILSGDIEKAYDGLK